jgi:peptide/nickel transport system substrate-binding protein
MDLRRRAASAWLVTLLFIVACAGPPEPGARDPGVVGGAPAGAAPTKRLVAAVMGEPASLSSRISIGVANVPGVDVLEELVNSGLATIDNRGAGTPRLAEAIPSIENGLWIVRPDGQMETTWRIRDNAFWHNGTPVTSADLLFTLEVARDSELPNFNDPAFSAIDSVTAPDARTVTVSWKRPYIDADQMFSPRFGVPLPRELLERPYREDKPSFIQLAYWSREFIGTGPYRLQEWATGSHVTLAANERYPLGRPRIDEIQVRFIPDQNTLIANVLSSAVQITIGRNVSLDQALQLRSQWTEGRVEVGNRGWSMLFPQFLNPDPPIVTNLQFRRALVHAIDRQQLVDTLMGGLVPVADSFINPNTAVYREIEPNIVRYPFDPTRGIRMLEDLGYSRGADGLLRESSAQALAVELRTVSVDLHVKTTLAVADAWQRIGITVDPVVIPPARQGDLEYRAGFPAFQIFGGQTDLGLLPRLHSSRTPLPETRYVGTNYSRFMEPEWDGLIDRLFATVPQQERTRVLGETVHYMTDRLNVIGLIFRDDTILVNNRVQHATALYGEGSTHAWNAHEWDLR